MDKKRFLEFSSDVDYVSKPYNEALNPSNFTIEASFSSCDAGTFDGVTAKSTDG